MAENKEQVAVIADSATCTGFRLAGVENTFALGGAEAEAKISELLGSEKFGIIVVSERMVVEVVVVVVAGALFEKHVRQDAPLF